MTLKACLVPSLFALTFSLPLSAQFTPPTPAELAMTSIPQVPNAPAVYLFKEETTEDALHMHSFYVRLKVLTEGGKEYANVELPYYAMSGGNSIDSISGRTIQPDGTIVPFTGKPYDKVNAKGAEFSYKSKVFTLPAVQVGSILEYRYKIRYDDAYLESPQWYIQSPLYTISGHYNWKPTTDMVVSSDRGDVQSSIAWTPILPPGMAVKQTALLGKQGRAGGNDAGGSNIDLVVHDIPPLASEESMPPVNSLSYRVLFYYTSYKTANEYWDKDGKRWAHERDKFIGPGSGVKNAVKELVSPTDTEQVKLKKIYAAVQAMDNTDFTRSHSAQEEKAQGLKVAKDTDDILARKRGTGDQLDLLFIAMVRAAGMKAYLMGVADRSERIFLSSYLSLRQLDDDIAIVPVDGKDMFFDPGSRLCTFGQLAWKHALTSGLRETDDGVKLAGTPGVPFTQSHTQRVADLTLNDEGVATGMVTVTYIGAPALRWRQEALRGDDTSLNADLRQSMERKLPGGMEVRVVDVANLNDSDKPLVVKYEVKGAVGNATGKRLLLPGALFESNAKPEFTAVGRETTVDMKYPELVQDAVRFKMPDSLVVESAPAADTYKIGNAAAYAFSSKQAVHAITLYRDVTIAKTFISPADYPELRTFYGKLDGKQQETLVLTRAGDGSAKPAPGGN